MEVTVELPDDLAEQLRMGGDDLQRKILESFALEGYKSGELTAFQVRRLLGFETQMELDAFLKQHGVSLKYDEEDLSRDSELSRQTRSHQLERSTYRFRTFKLGVKEEALDRERLYGEDTIDV